MTWLEFRRVLFRSELLENYILRTNTEPTDINCVSFLESERLPMSFEDSVRRIIMGGLSV